MKSLKKNAIFNTLKNIMGVFFPIITFPYVSRILGPVGIGKVNFSQSIISYFVMFAMLGVSNYGIREVGKVKGDKNKLSQVVSEILTINLISCVFSYILLFLSLVLFRSLDNYKDIILICSLNIFFTVLGLDWFYYAIEELGFVTKRTFIFQIISLILLFFFVKNENDYLIYAFIGVISSVGANVLGYTHSRKFITYNLCSLSEIKKHLRPIFIFFIMSIAGTINSSLDISMLGIMANDEQVGLYSTAMKVLRILISLTTSLTVILPRLSFYFSGKQIGEFRNLITKTFNMNVFLILPSITGLVLVAQPLIIFIGGEEYKGSINILKILSPIMLFIAISNIIGSHLLVAVEKEKVSFIAVFIGIFFNFIANIFLIPKFGAIGASVTTLISELVVCVIQIFFAYKFLIWKEIAVNFFQCSLGCVLIAIVVSLIIPLHMKPYLSLIISVFAGAVAYSLIAIILKNKCLDFLRLNRFIGRSK